MDVAHGVLGSADLSDDAEDGPLDWMSDQWLEGEICQWAANLTAAEAKWLGLIAEFDRRQGWARDGSVSCAKWLQDRIGFDRSTAHEKVRVAHALDRFPMFRVGNDRWSVVLCEGAIDHPDRIG